jgi:S1-C subfamily serine protease
MAKGHSRLVFFGVLSAMTGWAQPKPAREIAKQAFPSVVLVVMQDTSGQPTSQGSGFVVRDGQVVTNHHVIAGAVSGFVRLVDKSSKYEISGTVAIDDAHDLAVLAVPGLVAPSLPLGDSNKIAVGDEVYAIGNPQGLEGTFSQGIVSGIRRADSDTLLQMTAPISPGSSGGPILNGSGEVIGIAVATFTDGQNLNVAIPISYLTPLIGGIGRKVQPLSETPPSSSKRVVQTSKTSLENLKEL